MLVWQRLCEPLWCDRRADATRKGMLMSDFPAILSLTVTNRCNLRCEMCGQWGAAGYMKESPARTAELPLATWLRVIDEAAVHHPNLLVRGGEPFLYPGIVPLLARAKERGLPVSIDTNGTLLETFAADIVRVGVNHLSISVDGDEKTHDAVRGVKGSFARIESGVARLREEAGRQNRPAPGTVLVFIISKLSYKALPALPDAARTLGIKDMVIVPYYYFDSAAGAEYEKVMREELGSPGHSWRGFHREVSGVNPDEFIALFREFKARLGDRNMVPWMELSEQDYRVWFGNCRSPAGKQVCQSPWRLLDIQPNGDANFCIDFPDFVVGNINEHSVAELWYSDRADTFRRRIQKGLLPICARCGVKYV